MDPDIPDLGRTFGLDQIDAAMETLERRVPDRDAVRVVLVHDSA